MKINKLIKAVTNAHLKFGVLNYIFNLWKRLNAGTVPANKEYAAGTLSNVRKCWLAMP